MASNYVSSRIGSRTFQTSYKIRVLSDFTSDATPRGSEGRSGPTLLVSYILSLASHKTTFGRSSCTTSLAMESPLTCATNLHKQWPNDYQDTMNRYQCEGRPTRRSTGGAHAVLQEARPQTQGVPPGGGPVNSAGGRGLDGLLGDVQYVRAPFPASVLVPLVAQLPNSPMCTVFTGLAPMRSL